MESDCKASACHSPTIAAARLSTPTARASIPHCHAPPGHAKLQPIRSNGLIASACGRGTGVFVAASTDCFPGVPLEEALSRLVDLEFNRVEIGIHSGGHGLRPAEVLADLDRAIAQCRNTQRLTPVAYCVDPDPGDDDFQQFPAACTTAT